MFAYRHRQLAADLAAHSRTSQKLTVAISGASGLLGTQLAAFLTTGGHEVFRLVRRGASGSHEIGWDPLNGTIDAEKLAQCNAVVHLAGEPLLGRWTATKMRKILDSRARSTHLLASTLAGLTDGPKTLISASAIGFYPSAAEPLTEESSQGTGFLSNVVSAWERAADPAREANLRVVHPRIGIVLSPRGGLLRLQLPAFYAGLGGRIGDGRQWLSWISHDDAIGLLHHALITDDLAGPLNVVGPRPVIGRQFADELGSVLHRPAKIPLPLAAVRLALGTAAARELATASQRVIPEKAQLSGYSFRFEDLTTTLRHLLGREE
jgi:uncharacterized protein (TIGR01777 family)